MKDPEEHAKEQVDELKQMDFDRLVELVEQDTNNPFFELELQRRCRKLNEETDELLEELDKKNRKVERGLEALNKAEENKE